MDPGWLTTALILLPAAGALVIWILPLGPFAVGGVAGGLVTALDPAQRGPERGRVDFPLDRAVRLAGG